jgi:hypothetical protein
MHQKSISSKVSWILPGGKVNYNGSERNPTVVSAHDFPTLNDKKTLCEYGKTRLP